MRRLLPEGADIEAQARKRNLLGCSEEVSSLMAAVLNGHRQAVELLLEQGANVNAVNEDGSTALLFTFNGNGDRAIQSLLLRSGADPGIDDGEGWNVYSAAALCGGPQEEYLRTGFVAEVVAQIAALKETNATLEADLVAARAVERPGDAAAADADAGGGGKRRRTASTNAGGSGLLAIAVEQQSLLVKVKKEKVRSAAYLPSPSTVCDYTCACRTMRKRR